MYLNDHCKAWKAYNLWFHLRSVSTFDALEHRTFVILIFFIFRLKQRGVKFYHRKINSFQEVSLWLKYAFSWRTCYILLRDSGLVVIKNSSNIPGKWWKAMECGKGISLAIWMLIFTTFCEIGSASAYNLMSRHIKLFFSTVSCKSIHRHILVYKRHLHIFSQLAFFILNTYTVVYF